MKTSQSTFSMMAAILFAAPSVAQTVQLPSVGSFGISTTVAAPDRGSVTAGGVGSGQWGSESRGPGRGTTAIGGTQSGAMASVHATVIDLDELDRMIRSQAGKNPTEPELNSTDPSPHTRIPTTTRMRSAHVEYDYLAVLSGHGHVLVNPDPDAINYYLALAEKARLKGNWTAVELYYKLAWNQLPERRRMAALNALAKARSRPQSALADAQAKR